MRSAWEHRGQLADEFPKQWNAPSGWDRGRFHSEVRGWVMMTVLLFAKNLGFERVGDRSHGQPVYRRGSEFISPDVDRHNGGIWKKATGDARNLRDKASRDGTFDDDLTEMVGP